MNVDRILETFQRYQVDALLIGGMNFLLRHQPVLTFDVDFWIKDSDENLKKVAEALRELKAEWGRDDASWGPIPQDGRWLQSQLIFCLTTPYGAVDIFREVRGLEGQYDECRTRSTSEHTSGGIAFQSLSDQDMLACQLALPESQRRLDRTAFLQNLKSRP